MPVPKVSVLQRVDCIPDSIKIAASYLSSEKANFELSGPPKHLI